MLKGLIALVATAVLVLPTAAFAGRPAHETALLRQMNAVRGRDGLRPLRLDPRLERAAVSHSREMLASGVFTHGAFASRMARFDIHGSFAGENLAWGTGSQATPQGVVAAWLASPAHRANLLRPGFTRVGIGDLVGAFLGHPGADVVTADFAG